MTDSTNTPAKTLDDSSLDLVVGGAIMVPDLRRKQEQEDKLTAEQGQK